MVANVAIGTLDQGPREPRFAGRLGGIFRTTVHPRRAPER